MSIVEIKTAAVVLEPSDEMRQMTGGFLAAIERQSGFRRWQFSDKTAPSASQARQLHIRLGEVNRALDPCGDREIAEFISAMFMGFPNLKMSAPEARKTAALFTSQLRGYPAWAIKRACEDILQDRASGRSPDFAPSVPVMVAVCRDHLDLLRQERENLKTILEADVYREPTASEKAKVSAEFERLIADLKLRDPYEPTPPTAPDSLRMTAEARLEALASEPVPMLSEAARRAVDR